MPETRAVTLANIASSDAFTVDNANDRVGIGSTVPDATLDIKNTVIVDGVAGVVTAIAFDGDGSRLTGVANTDVVVSSASTTGRLVVNNDATVSGVTTAGGVILKDTNIVAGVVTGSTFVGDGSGLTGVANTDVVHTREITASGVSTFSGTINAQAISGTSAAFTGNIDLNSDTNKLKIGAGDDFQLYHNGSNNFIETNNGDINITTTGDDINITAADDMNLAVQGGEDAIKAFGNGPVELYYDNTERFQTNTDGVEVTHVATANTMRMFVGGSVGVGIGVTTTTGRNAAAGIGTVKGQIVYNETAGQVEVYTGTAWRAVEGKTTVSGGTETTSGVYTIHTFTSSGSLVVSGKELTADYLVVAGGGGGGGTRAGGGGAGGMIESPGQTIPVGTHTVTIGNGGTGGPGVNSGAAGGPSSLGSLATANGGAYGGGQGNPGGPGGSGGGGSDGAGGGEGTPGQGNDGGSSQSDRGGGGGGGKGGAGSQGPTGTGEGDGAGGAGGAAGSSSYSGATVNYSGGGGGGSRDDGTPGSGGGGGAGAGGKNPTTPAGNASPNQGGGGGGGGRHPTGATLNGGNGGSGVVIVRYQTDSL